jgi:2-polyprenyl-3-methyl-5-hydroxy-6-metoxy-1,4-benzoquinol methylase
MYESLSSDYDRFVDWQSRLSIELPFILEKLRESDSKYVLDAATGTGMHAIALAQLGFQASGADISRGMIERACMNARSAGVQTRFEIAGFGTLADTFGAASFEAVLCLGNSLPHLLSRNDLDKTLVDFAACLKPGGMLLIQNRNFDAVIANHDRWMEPQTHSEGDAEWIFQRFYDFEPDGSLIFNMVTLTRNTQSKWTQQIVASRMRPIMKVELILSLSEAGFVSQTPFGDMTGTAFDPEKSPNLVVLARKHI